jgi:DhnA family fructose-bisphosphate aldolase class Ia
MIGLKQHRWDHIFAKDGKALIFAMDHAGAFGMMAGIEKPGDTIHKVAAGGADAILTTYGVCKNFMPEIGKMGIVLRVDGGSSKLSKEGGVNTLLYTVQDALRIGADAVGSMGLPGSKYESETLPYLADLVAQAAEWNMPVMAEMLPAGFENPKEWWTPENIGHACRIGAEYGVDFIKTEYPKNEEAFQKICSQIYVPIVVLGGGKVDDVPGFLNGIYAAMKAGANGVAVGRNIYQHPYPDKITAAIAAIVHKNATVEAAMEFLK